MKKGHSFPSKFGFSGSRGKVKVTPHMRSAPKVPKVPPVGLPRVPPAKMPKA